MYTQPVEIHSDATNFAVMRHPDRRFPGSLVQGDTLHTLWRAADAACRCLSGEAPDVEGALVDIVWLRDALRDRVNHYKEVLAEHSLPLPFKEAPTIVEFRQPAPAIGGGLAQTLQAEICLP